MADNHELSPAEKARQALRRQVRSNCMAFIRSRGINGKQLGEILDQPTASARELMATSEWHEILGLRVAEALGLTPEQAKDPGYATTLPQPPEIKSPFDASFYAKRNLPAPAIREVKSLIEDLELPGENS